MPEVEVADIKVGVGVKLTGLDVGWAHLHDLQRVYLWDIGPEKPAPPIRPPLPKGKEGDPEYDLAKVEFADALARYDAELKEHGRRKAEYASWERQCGGPVEMEFWSVNAREALDSDVRAVAEGRQTRRRWYLSSRTRGSERLPNRGLPEGMKPGHGQADLERTRKERDADFADAMRRDPIFGEAV